VVCNITAYQYTATAYRMLTRSWCQQLFSACSRGCLLAFPCRVQRAALALCETSGGARNSLRSSRLPMLCGDSLARSSLSLSIDIHIYVHLYNYIYLGAGGYVKRSGAVGHESFALATLSRARSLSLSHCAGMRRLLNRLRVCSKGSFHACARVCSVSKSPTGPHTPQCLRSRVCVR
jgi:hypothetical protein